MDFHVLTLFPEMIDGVMSESIMGRAIEKGSISCEAVNIRDYSKDKHRRVDDYTYGGGAGMLMQAQPIYDAYRDVKKNIPDDHKTSFIYVTPQGRPFTQDMAKKFAEKDDIVILCGHYEGVDERVLTELNATPVSVGDYVLTGGELPALIIMDAVARLVPDVLHNEASAEIESFHRDLLEYPQYTRPEEWHGMQVPQVLLSGNIKEVAAWREEQAVKRTRERRPDLFEKYSRMENIRQLLIKKKREYADMIYLIDSGRAQIITRIADAVLLRDSDTGVCYFANLSADVIRTEEVFEKLYEMTKGEIASAVSALVCHGACDADQIMEILDLAGVQKKVLGVYTLKEKISVSKVKKLSSGKEVSKEVQTFLTNRVNGLLEAGFIPHQSFSSEDKISIDYFNAIGFFASQEPIYDFFSSKAFEK